MSTLPFPVNLRSAQLSRGRLSHELPIASPVLPPNREEAPSTQFETLEDLHSLIEANLKGSGSRAREVQNMASSDDLGTLATSGGYVLERPAWQAFLVMLQTHFPEMGEEISPAHFFGVLPPPRVVLTQDAIDFLNIQMDFMYGKQVEITTITVATPGDSRMGPTTEILYENPFRPVTGLNLIVTPTVQTSLLSRDRRILKEKETWGTLSGLQAIERFIQVCVFDRTQTCPPDPRVGGPKRISTGGVSRSPSLLSRAFSKKEKRADWGQMRLVRR